IDSTSEPKKALKLIKNNTYHLIITDLKMPEVDGIEITKAAKEKNKETDIIVITGYASLESAISALRQNVYDYILKPFNISEILLTVEKVFEKQRLKKANLELIKKVEKALNNISTLFEIGKIINSSVNLEQVLSFTAETISNSVGIETFFIVLYNRFKKRFEIRTAYDLSEETEAKFTFNYNSQIYEKMIHEDKIPVIPNFKEEEEIINGFSGKDLSKIEHFIPFLLKTEDENFGFLVVNKFSEDNLATEEKTYLLQIITTQIAPMIKLMILKENIDKMSQDPLLSIRVESDKIFEKAKLYQGSFTIFLFKYYPLASTLSEFELISMNKAIINFIAKKITNIDKSISISMDTFLIILQGKSQIQIEHFASHLKNDIEDSIFENLNVNIIANYGYASYPDHGSNLEEVLSKSYMNLWKDSY
ncbi:response regulator, partial [candidate division KSB1 bacterium]